MKRQCRIAVTIVVLGGISACGSAQRGQAEHPEATLQQARAETAQCKEEHRDCTSRLNDAQAQIEELERDEMAREAALAAAQDQTAAYGELAAEFVTAFNPDPVRVYLREGRVLVQLPSDVLFDFGSAEVRSEAMPVLAQVATMLREVPDRKFLIAGHTDNIPVKENNPEYETNVELSALRAMAVRRILEDDGVSPSQITAMGYGEHLPIAANDSADGRQSNRRIEVIVMPTLAEVPELPELPAMPVEPEDLAQAEEEEEIYEEEEPYEEEAAREEEERAAMIPPAEEVTVEEKVGPRYAGYNLELGGGAFTFTDGDARDFTNAAGAWGVRLSLGTHRMISGEVTYNGTAQEVGAIGLQNDAVLLSNGFDGKLRFNPMAQFNMRSESAFKVNPYAFVGAGFRRYTIVNSPTRLSSVRNDDNVFEIPVGVGFAVEYRRMVFDMRGIYRRTWEDEMFDNADPFDNPSLHTIGGIATVGVSLW